MSQSNVKVFRNLDKKTSLSGARERLRKALPAVLTLANLLCGVGVLLWCVDGRPLEQAALLIFIGFVLDLADGRVARLLDATSDFGKELDSLVDIVTFGVAPAVLFYVWSDLGELGVGGAAIAACFVVAAALRLARFNLTTRTPQPSHGFAGLPTPIAAGSVAVLVLFDPHGVHAVSGFELLRLTFLPILALLMLSQLRYPSGKHVARGGSGSLLFLLAMTVLVLGSLVLPWLGALVLGAYLLSGPLDAIFASLTRPRPEGVER